MLIDDSPIPADAKFRKIIIPSVDTVRYTYLLDMGVRHEQPVMIVGPTGTGACMGRAFSVQFEQWVGAEGRQR